LVGTDTDDENSDKFSDWDNSNANVGGVGATYVATPTGATPSGALRTLAVNIDGTVYHILAAAVYSS